MAINVSEEPGASLFTHAMKHRGSRLIRNFGTDLPNSKMFMQNDPCLNSNCRKNLISHKNFSISVHFLRTAQEENKRKKVARTKSRLLSFFFNSWFRASQFNVNKNPTRCNSMQIFIHCKVTLHVSGVTAPIIRRTLQ